MKKLILPITLLVASISTGCEFHARSADDYRKDTRQVLETRLPQLKECYDAALKQDKQANGEVVVHLVVQKKTGDFAEIELSGKADEPVRECVKKALQGLKLTPVDERDGHGEFTFKFSNK
jgi:hypothetical protein